jgi:YHS domain-containing protein
MDRVVSFLIFAAFFYFMMRFGCGSHMVHGGGHRHAGDGHGGHDAANPRDPVCGMVVAPDKGYAEIYAGTTYRFCSKKCLEKFDTTPEQYLAA